MAPLRDVATGGWNIAISIWRGQRRASWRSGRTKSPPSRLLGSHICPRAARLVSAVSRVLPVLPESAAATGSVVSTDRHAATWVESP